MEVLRAIDDLKKESIPFKYAIVGEGPFKAKCLSYVSQHGLTECVDFTAICQRKTSFL